MVKTKRFTTLKFATPKAEFLFLLKIFSLVIFGSVIIFFSIYYDSLILLFVELGILYLLFIAITIPSYKGVKTYIFTTDYIKIYDATIWGKKNEKLINYSNIITYWKSYDINRLILKDDQNIAVILVRGKLDSFDFVVENIVKYQFENYNQKIQNNVTLEFNFHDFDNYKTLAKSPNAESYFQNTKRIELNKNFIKINAKSFSWNDIRNSKVKHRNTIELLSQLYDGIRNEIQIENYEILDKLITEYR